AALPLTLLGPPSPLAPRSAAAASFVVTKLADTNDGVCDADCSLREAMTAAMAAGSGNTVTFGLGGTFTLNSTLPVITTTLSIDGTGRSVDLNGGGAALQPFQVNSG